MTKTNLAVGMAEAKTHIAPSTAAASGTSVELAVIVPTYNERDNVKPLIELLESTLLGMSWEVIFVDDDSPDGTGSKVQAFSSTDPRVHLLTGTRQGLGDAYERGNVVRVVRGTAKGVTDGVVNDDRSHEQRKKHGVPPRIEKQGR